MMWFGLLIMFGGLVVLFVLWDLVFCGGRRCGELRSALQTSFETSGARAADRVIWLVVNVPRSFSAPPVPCPQCS